MLTHRLVLALTIATAVSASALSGQRIVRGVVFADANGNGRRDPGELGIPNVVVSNQETIVLTDSAGRYAIAVGSSKLIDVSVPDNFRSVSPFWHAAGDSGSTSFALQPSPQSRDFTFIHASDTHLSAASLDKMQRFRFLADSTGAAFTLVVGDLVLDATATPEAAARAYFELFGAEARKFKAPVWAVPGNKDHFGIIRPRSGISPTDSSFNRGMYHQYFGPDYYSFTYGGVHFIGLNSIQVDDSAYYGGIDRAQLAWLRRDVATIPAAMPIVVYNHIPFTTGADMISGYRDLPYVGPIAHPFGKPVYRHTVWNALKVLGAMKSHRVLALGAHTHIGEKITYQTSAGLIRFEQSASIIGGPQTGVIDIPSGFTLYTVHQGEIDAGRFVGLNMKAGK